MSSSLRFLSLIVCGLIVVNAAMLWGVWHWMPAYSLTGVVPTATTRSQSIAMVSRPSDVTAKCRMNIKEYLDQSSARMYAYFAYQERLTAANHLILAAEVLALSKDFPVLPDSCPESFDTALHINYLSVYSSAPIHLHRYLTTATDLPRENANMRIAWRYFEREADVAEQSMYQLLRLIQ